MTSDGLESLEEVFMVCQKRVDVPAVRVTYSKRGLGITSIQHKHAKRVYTCVAVAALWPASHFKSRRRFLAEISSNYSVRNLEYKPWAAQTGSVSTAPAMGQVVLFLRILTSILRESLSGQILFF